MNIIKAAKALQEGRKIARRGWGLGVCFRKVEAWNPRVVLERGDNKEPDGDLELLVSDLLAADWKIIDE